MPRTVSRRLSSRILTLFAVGALAALGVTVGGSGVPSATAATPSTTAGCGYGVGGANADTTCWIDMSSFDPAQANSAAGQPMTLHVGTYTITMQAKQVAGAGGAERPLAAVAAPTWPGAVFGQQVYAGVPGKPALYQLITKDTGDTGSIELTNIHVTDAAGGTVTGGYSFVMADAESTNRFESLSFSADTPVNVLASVTPPGHQAPCGGSPVQLSSTQITCAGTVGSVGMLTTAAVSPSSVSIGFTDGGGFTSRQGVAFGVMFSKIGVTKQVTNRLSTSDSFSVTAATGGENLATASTGPSDTATTGPQTVLANVAGQPATFTESVDAGSPSSLSDYLHSWACTDDGNAIPDAAVTYNADKTQATTNIALGDDVECTVTNTGITPGLHVTKTADPASGQQVRAGQTITYTITGSNTGNVDLNPVTISDDLSKVLDHAAFVAGSATAAVNGVSVAAPTLSGKTLAWTGPVPTGQSLAITYQAVVDADITATDTLVNVVQGAGTYPGNPSIPVPTNCTPATAASTPDCNTTNTTAVPGLHIAKTSNPSTGGIVEPGQKIAYTVTATNTGDTDLNPVTVSDDLSEVLAHATYGSGDASVDGVKVTAPVLTGDRLTWTGDVPQGQSATITYTVTVDSNAPAAAKLVNVVTGSGTDPGNPGTSVASNCMPGTAATTADCHTVSTVNTPVVPAADPPAGASVHTGGFVVDPASGFPIWPLTALGAGIALILAMLARRRRAE